MNGYLGAVITDGPNKGRTVGECIVLGCNISKQAKQAAKVIEGAGFEIASRGVPLQDEEPAA